MSNCDKNWFNLRFEQLGQGNLDLKTRLKQMQFIFKIILQILF